MIIVDGKKFDDGALARALLALAANFLERLQPAGKECFSGRPLAELRHGLLAGRTRALATFEALTAAEDDSELEAIEQSLKLADRALLVFWLSHLVLDQAALNEATAAAAEVGPDFMDWPLVARALCDAFAGYLDSVRAVKLRG